MEHKCEANRWQIKIKYYENPGLWIWGDINEMGANHINVCPYCGLKLEPPEEKFDFDKWHDKLWHEYAVALSERTDRLFMGDDPEPPDVIEVSRETLLEWRGLARTASTWGRSPSMGKLVERIGALLDD